MKVVLFCGGQGMRIREYSGGLPKPMVRVGYRPILWHIMKFYAHYGHTDFILCLGHQGDKIKEYFLNYDECVSNDFVLSKGGRQVDLIQSDIHDWTITFVDTGLDACVGERLMAVKPYLEGEDYFLANYADGVSDVPLPKMIDFARAHGKAACFLGVQPNYTSHVVATKPDGTVSAIQHVSDVGLRINGGFFVLRTDVFDYMEPGDELVEAPFRRMIEAGQLASYVYDGFWACMDTFKEKQMLEEIQRQGDAPWEVWNREPVRAPDLTLGPASGDGAMKAVSVVKSEE
ncbi:MAG: glucose-1-phosphate cytidylyltransferase [Bacteroidota bacterium]